jgi:hypothetical protein
MSLAIYRYLDSTKANLQGAYVLDVVMNYNTTPNSQVFPRGSETILPKEYKWIENDQFRGDWLAVMGREKDDSVLRNKFVSNFKQGIY